MSRNGMSIAGVVGAIILGIAGLAVVSYIVLMIILANSAAGGNK